jgi:hypothetical protein
MVSGPAAPRSASIRGVGGYSRRLSDLLPPESAFAAFDEKESKR